MVHLALWPALVVWAAILTSRRRSFGGVRSMRIGLVLALVCFLADGATLAASFTWPTRDSNSFVFALLWLAVLLSVTAYLVLRAPDDGGDGPEEAEPEPPWWPEFERQFRDYTGSRPREPAGRPREPASTTR